MPMSPRVSFSHVGLYARDIDRLSTFYTRHLGLMITDTGEIGGARIVFMSSDPSEHHQVVLLSGRPDDVPFNVVNQISFRLETLDDLKAAFEGLKEDGVTGFRPITHGNAWSVYFPDPEGNRIELFVDSPWHVAQPCGEPIDLAKPADEIMAETEALARGLPGFQPRAQWQRALAEKMAAR